MFHLRQKFTYIIIALNIAVIDMFSSQHRAACYEKVIDVANEMIGKGGIHNERKNSKLVYAISRVNKVELTYHHWYNKILSTPILT